MFHRETPNPISLNQRVLGSSPSASTIFFFKINVLLGLSDKVLTCEKVIKTYKVI